MKLSQSLINNWVIKFNFHLWLNNRERSIKKLISFRIKKCAKGFQSWLSFLLLLLFSVTLFLFFSHMKFISSRLFVTSFKWKLEVSHLNIISIVGSSNLNFSLSISFVSRSIYSIAALIESLVFSYIQFFFLNMIFSFLFFYEE